MFAGATVGPAWGGAAPSKAGAAALEQLRRSFTLGGKPVPPEVFRDLGDGDLADSGSIWVAVDVKAAIGSNLYVDAITVDGPWTTQTKRDPRGSGVLEETSYRYVGATRKSLLVAVARYNGGGTGVFTTLHILDAAAGSAFTADGDRTDRVTVTDVRSIPLGDRWDGTVTITGDTIAITTTGGPPAGQHRRPATRTIEAERP